MKLIFKYIFIVIVIASVFLSCKKKDEKLGDGILNFSHDTLFFDTTVFTGVKTITRQVTVYNFNSNAVTISEISIPEGSPFSLIIDGRKTNKLENHVLRGNDHLLVLLEATLERNNEDTILIVEENIKFITNGSEQKVTLVAPGLDVYFHNGEVLSCNEVWKNDHPHLIYNSVLVPANCKLTIEEGTHTFFSSRSGIFVEGTLEAIGTPEKRIIFTDDRLESDYNEIYGIWEGIIMFPGSNNNILDWVHINNSVNGVYVNTESPNDGTIDLLLSHSIINSIGNNSNAPSLSAGSIYTGFGVVAINSDVVIHNSLIENCTVGSAFFLLNGSHALVNNTFANYPVNSYNRPKEVRTFYASSVSLDAVGNVVEVGEMNLEMYNNIVYGENSDPEEENNLDEIILTYPSQGWQFYNNIIKSGDVNQLAIIDAPDTDNILNENPFDYGDFDPEEDDFELRSGSNAIDAGSGGISILGVPDIDIDLNGELRTDDWDIGAYEFK